MFVIIGIAVVIIGVFGGYALEGGNMHVLLQPAELVVLGGAALGGLLVSAPLPVLKIVIKQTLGCMAEKGGNKAQYVELLMLLYEILKTAKMNPLSIEPHVENPEGSEIFKKYPGILKNHHLMSFLCDTLKVQVSSALSPYDLDELMDTDINATHDEELKGPAAISRVADALPGLGIVAAVLGVVITMGKLTQGKEVIGHSVAAALIGTFLGILGSYGFLQPIAAKMENNIAEEGDFLIVVKSALVAYAKDAPPKVCIEFARRRVPPKSRPSFAEVDAATSNSGKKAA